MHIRHPWWRRHHKHVSLCHDVRLRRTVSRLRRLMLFDRADKR